jgi:DUF2934 family protein
MSTRYNDGSHYENHQRAAELHDLAAHTHRTGQQHGKLDHETGHEHSRQALEHSQAAHRQSEASVNRHGTTTYGHREIAELAHDLWKARGCPDGSPEEDWFRAKEELAGRALKARNPG